jgi:hypothetical protein
MYGKFSIRFVFFAPIIGNLKSKSGPADENLKWLGDTAQRAGAADKVIR